MDLLKHGKQTCLSRQSTFHPTLGSSGTWATLNLFPPPLPGAWSFISFRSASFPSPHLQPVWSCESPLCGRIPHSRVPHPFPTQRHSPNRQIRAFKHANSVQSSLFSRSPPKLFSLMAPRFSLHSISTTCNYKLSLVFYKFST